VDVSRVAVQTRTVARATTHYERLGVPTTATAADIRSAYRELARQHHPDVANGSAAVDMAAVNEAWRVLGDPERRAAYDATLAGALPRREPSPAPPAASRRGDEARHEGSNDEDEGEDEDDWRLDVPITDGRAVRTLGIMVAVTAALALAAVTALFAYAILWAG
jgi:curved DNA-binding protein CbpA